MRQRSTTAPHLSRKPWRRVACLAIALLGPAFGQSGEASTKPPNLLLIISDDHAWTDYGFMGHPHLRTPQIDRLARESLCFPRGYVTSSLCCPSLASIITGRFPHQHRVTSNDPPLPTGMSKAEAYGTAAFRDGRRRMNEFLEATPTLPRVLRTRGYLSLQTGKWWQGNFRHGGFTHGMTLGEEGKQGRHGDAGLAIGREGLQPIYDFVKEARREGKPFLVWYAPMMPHDPHTPPQRLLDRYRVVAPSLAVAKYWAMVEWFDETCGELLGYLDREGLAEDTIVAYVADNGWITDPETGRFAPKSKQSPYDGGLRTPILLRWPGHWRPERVETPVSSVDLMPTLLRACGIDRPEGLPGVNVVDAAAVREREAVFGACFTHDAVDLERPASSLRWRWMVAGDWKLIVPSRANEPAGGVELYSLAVDPYERQNLAEVEKNRLELLRRQLDGWWTGS